MKKVFVFFFLFLFSGCSINSLMLFGELDKVHVVKRSSYLKHYRAYFQRTSLKPISHGKKYLYFYNKRSKDFAVLLHPKHKYILYSFSHYGSNIKISSSKKHGYYRMIKMLKRKGYRVTSPHTVGYTTKVSLRKYKKVKTLLVEVKNYQNLQNIYKKAIKTYNARRVKSIKTRLPKVLIESYFKKYKAAASTQEQLKQLNIIAAKLHLHKAISTTDKIEDRESQTTANTEETTTKQLYNYYLKKASYYELNNYLSTSEAKNRFNYDQYNTLRIKNSQLQEQNFLQNSSLEELITAYRKNKNPNYKSKIMQRIKEIQKNK